MLRFHNSLTRRAEPFSPEDPANVRMYVCGPTVYQAPHIGNARSVVIYDVLFRLLRATYGETAVTYARNITDVDDKINAAAVQRGIPIAALTREVTAEFHADIEALGCLPPTVEPRATEHLPQIVAMIETLISNGRAYAAEGHVLFDVTTDPEYGCLSHRSPDEMLAGARVEVAPYKKNSGDFVLWKPSAPTDDPSARFASPWGEGRPGWHIECSAMACDHLGETFDLHGGGADLMFPHHENEIAQSRGANPGSDFARVWLHNGFLTVGGEKMSKSLGNFVTVRELLDKGVRGEVIRWALLSTHYRKPLDWTEKLIDDARKQLDYFYRAIVETEQHPEPRPGFAESLSDDLNVPEAIASLHQMDKSRLKASAALLGLLQGDADAWFKGEGDDPAIRARIAARAAAKKARDFTEADRIRDALKAEGILLMDKPDGSTDWQKT